ncbi:hypothetical protein JNW91_00600 [Micromonospora sp. STR1_7]|uniref:Uncharacterized protein n=1 Tax=Micromonospora parastrephiae TaxID=2806101 RepID=A0ABS1XMK3_9ACTN|nr:hypothetical protein [Micromonospora parastrephiae]MBM0230501.1 hypothetical protein [Micromonospora parastrephiae]
MNDGTNAKVPPARLPDVSGRWAGATDAEQKMLVGQAHAEAIDEDGDRNAREFDRVQYVYNEAVGYRGEVAEHVDARTVSVVFSFPADGVGRSMPIRDEAGRIRICETDGNRVGWARLTEFEWTDTLP